MASMEDTECFYCGKVLKWDRPDNGLSEYCDEECFDKQGEQDREEDRRMLEYVSDQD